MSDYVNYQLYRTNPKLGGQMKLDLILGKSGEDLSIRDIHITPISNKVPYNRLSHETLIEYSHQENISKFYKNILGSFYKEFVDQKLSNPWPIISNNEEDTCEDTHEDTYEMGLRRMRYGLYGKQFSFLIPVWLEKVKNLAFDIEVYSTDSKRQVNKLSTKTLRVFGPGLQSKPSKYIEQYFDYIGISTGNNNCISIHLDKGTSQISGLDVRTGSNKVLDLPHLVNNLTSRERPLLEFDNMIINQFEDNCLVAHQLLNFNICFNLEDVIPGSFIQDFMGGQFGVKIFARVDEERLDIVDFFSNYEYIPKKDCGPIKLVEDSVTTLNVLDYLKDYNCIDLIDKNKIVQSTIHWSLVGNNDYILNVYDGFGGYVDEVKISHSYDNTPDLLSQKYLKSLNNIGWANYVELSGGEPLSSIAGNIIQWYKKSSDFTKMWVNNIKYNYTTHLNHLNVLLVHTDEDIEGKYVDKFLKISEAEDVYIMKWTAEELFWRCDGGFIIFVSKNLDNITFKSILNILNGFLKNRENCECENCECENCECENCECENCECENCENCECEKYIKYISELYKILNSVDPSSNPPMIFLRSTVDLIKTKSPSLSSTEHEYIKNDHSTNYVMRYSGKVRPTFINPESSDINYNYEYYKDIVKDYNTSKYRIYDGSGLTPKFPSIGYFSIRREKQNYISPLVEGSYEFNRFNNNLVLLIPSEINIKCLSDKNGNGIEEAIENHLRFIDSNIEYVKSLYNTTINLEYISDNSINEYVYDIKLKLK